MQRDRYQFENISLQLFPKCNNQCQNLHNVEKNVQLIKIILKLFSKF